MATFSIVQYCQQIGEDSALVIPQNIRGRIPHSVFRKVFSPPALTVSGAAAKDLRNRCPPRLHSLALSDFMIILMCKTKPYQVCCHHCKRKKLSNFLERRHCPIPRPTPLYSQNVFSNYFFIMSANFNKLKALLQYELFVRKIHTSSNNSN